jgi:phospholipid/cholesterol/gamma-HCH transport system substrate-binding protein
MNHNAIETVLGAVVIFIAGFFLVFAMGAADMKRVSGYDVSANFSKADGINQGLDVRISGVKVGTVEKTELDPKTYLAKVTMTIAPNIQLPTDTVAKVASESLLGGKYMALEPGADDTMIKPNGQIQYTQTALNLEEMIGKFIFSTADKDKDKKSGDTSAPAANAAPAAKPADPYSAAQ